jgi:predicted ATP-dependent endonuclease of OLD family
VEQLLALATFVISSAAGNLICVDEPHSFLHPAAERLLLEFLRKHREHCYLITTHSAIFINSVPATGITYLSGEGAGTDDRRSHATAQLLFDLGYKNSDLLFADRVIFVEGETDKQVLPILLEKAGLDPSVLATTAICKLKGSGDLHTITRQSEDLLTALYKDTILRVYLFDGDKRPKKDYMQKIKNVRTGQEIPVAFLSRTEIEDYLLDPYAIAAAMAEEKNADQNGSEQAAYSPDQVNSWLREAAAKLGSSAKGSEILSHVYEQASFRYKKTEHGRLIGLRTSLETNPALLELLEPLRFVLTTELL